MADLTKLGYGIILHMCIYAFTADLPEQPYRDVVYNECELLALLTPYMALMFLVFELYP